MQNPVPCVQIGESLNRFGVQDTCTSLLIARFDATADHLGHIRSIVHGTEAPLTELPSLTNTALVRKYYKIADEELKVSDLGKAIVTRMACRDCT
jgi:Kinase binding protein CGI-121